MLRFASGPINSREMLRFASAFAGSEAGRRS